MQEKWVIFTPEQDHFMFDLAKVSDLESQLRLTKTPYRTIYYIDNQPIRFELDKGLIIMTQTEEQGIVKSVKERCHV
ncbi:hypothetical protein MUN88_17280 [Gracilibacillus caseinilyticus]|uniref:CYTH domain-containing protein n=1 Tax=Gracilibacillus caseinilyticus TaxID=2932256 RepID=A0ABY4ETP0_9BACI|nr:hypothetical protein [Gracilibacillus caseinilyticus]UOQ47785.1 hypothetical protein MUN88_17280 [Gracilibacillus caseinilyticus]